MESNDPLNSVLPPPFSRREKGPGDEGRPGGIMFVLAVLCAVFAGRPLMALGMVLASTLLAMFGGSGELALRVVVACGLGAALVHAGLLWAVGGSFRSLSALGGASLGFSSTVAWTLGAFVLLLVGHVALATLWPQPSPEGIPGLMVLRRALADPWAGGIVLFHALLMAPLVEEWAYRGRLMPLLARGFRWAMARGTVALSGEGGGLGSVWGAVLLQAVIFSAVHGEPARFFTLAWGGLVAGGLSVATGRIEAAVALHMMVNGVAVGAFLGRS